MAHLARSKYLVLRFAEEVTFNAQAFVEGKLELFSNSRLTVHSALVGRDVQLKPIEIPWLLSLPESLSSDHWTEATASFNESGLDPARILELIREGVVLYDPGDDDPTSIPESAVEMLERHRLIDAIPWHPTTLYVHLSNQDHEHQNAAKSEPLDLVARTQDSEASAEKFLDKFGEPPPAFFEASGDGDWIPLDAGERQGALYETLTQRRTIRAFDASRPVTKETFSSILRYVFGCFGRHTLSPRFFSLHKTSPSGGSLHPIEAYPVVSNVEGLDSGFYHYETRRHGLRRLPVDEPPVELLEGLAQGQSFVAQAHFVVFLVARYPRNFWKYRRRINTYHVILKDVGHLSQTFQLVAGEQSLGAFYTGAIDPTGVLQALGFGPEDRFRYGPIGVLGAGYQDPNDQTLMPLVAYDPIAARD